MYLGYKILTNIKKSKEGNGNNNKFTNIEVVKCFYEFKLQKYVAFLNFPEYQFEEKTASPHVAF